MQSLEKDREQKFGQVASQLKYAAEQTALLQETAHQLRQALSSTRARGQWGERMAEDVLRLSGLHRGRQLPEAEGPRYRRRPAGLHLPPAPGTEGQHGRQVPPGQLRPLSWRADRDAERESLKTQFLRDVKARIKEVTTRDYINPEENTLDYVLVFIPNEQVYAFINENEPFAPRRRPEEQGHPLLAVHALRHPGHHPPGHGQFQAGGDGREHAEAHGDVPQAVGPVRPVDGEDGEEAGRGPVGVPGL